MPEIVQPPTKRLRKEGRKDGTSPSRSSCHNKNGEGPKNTDGCVETCTPPSDGGQSGDSIVVLNVGGTCITALASTIRAYPSRLSKWLDDDFRDFPRDEKCRPFIDRDAVNFKHILNYLRGYGLPSKPADIVLLAEDAVFYDMAALKVDIGLEPPRMWRFKSGPGVSPDGTAFSTSSIVGLCGNDPLAMNRPNEIAFHIDKCELVTVGVVASDSVAADKQLQSQRHTVCYCSTGELVQYLGEDPLYATGTSFKFNDLITIKVSFVKSDATIGPETTPRVNSDAVSGALPMRLPDLQPPPMDAVQLGRYFPASTSRFHYDSTELPEEGPNETLTDASYTSLAENKDTLDAIITFSKNRRTEFEVRWCAPVPPLQFAVSMQGMSSVSVKDTSSVPEGDSLQSQEGFSLAADMMGRD